MSQILSRFSPSAIKNQVLKIWKTVAIGVLISLGGAGFTVLIAKLTDSPIWMLTRDPAEIRHYPPYLGTLSNWSIILWMTTAVICLFSAVILKQQRGTKTTIWFLVASGAFSLLLGIDDQYLLHDRLFPRIFHMPEMLFYLLYFFAFVAYTVYFTYQILNYDYLLFVAAFLFFVFSRQFLIEIPYFSQFNTTSDMLKYFGIVFWLIFFYRVSLREVNALLHSEKQPA